MSRRSMNAWVVSFLFAFPSLTTAAERIFVNGMVCERLSQTFVMRDTAMCGSDSVYCMTPVRCSFLWNPSFGGNSVATCRTDRAERAAAFSEGSIQKLPGLLPDGPHSCPSLQQCAEALDPEMEAESNLSEWESPIFCATCGVDDPRMSSTSSADKVEHLGEKE